MYEVRTPATAVPAASFGGVKRPFMTTSAQVVLSSSAVPLDSVIEHDVTRPLASMSTANRSEEHTSELQSLMRISYAVFCLKKKKTTNMRAKRTPTEPIRIHIKAVQVK